MKGLHHSFITHVHLIMKLGTDLELDMFYQTASKYGRRNFLYSAMRELVYNGQLWARAVLRQLRSYKVGQREQKFGENHGDDGCYSI